MELSYRKQQEIVPLRSELDDSNCEEGKHKACCSSATPAEGHISQKDGNEAVHTAEVQSMFDKHISEKVEQILVQVASSAYDIGNEIAEKQAKTTIEGFDSDKQMQSFEMQLELDDDIVEIVQMESASEQRKEKSFTRTPSATSSRHSARSSDIIVVSRKHSKDRSVQPLSRINSQTPADSSSREQQNEVEYTKNNTETGKNAQDAEHSICALDPVTNRRFYEPHKRFGCKDEYCLSRVTQIGERVCAVENKVLQLAEFFQELIRQRSIAKTPTAPTSSTDCRVPVNHIKRIGPYYQPYIRMSPYTMHNQTYTRSPIVSRISAKNSPQSFASNQPLVQARQRYLGDVIRPADGMAGLRSVVVPFRTLAHGIRIYYPANLANWKMCPVCFLKLENAHELEKHILRHSDERVLIEFCRCLVCLRFLPSQQVHFLSASSVLQHLIEGHGASNPQTARNFVELSSQRGDSKLVQLELRRFSREKLKQWSQGMGQLPNRKPARETPDIMSNKRSQKEENEGPRDIKKEKGKPVMRSSDTVLFGNTYAVGGHDRPDSVRERFKRLKNIYRTPTEQLIVSIGERCETLINEGDFRLANTVASANDMDGEIGGTTAKEKTLRNRNLKSASHTPVSPKSSTNSTGADPLRRIYNNDDVEMEDKGEEESDCDSDYDPARNKGVGKTRKTQKVRYPSNAV